LLRT
jgi:hypothetical protein